MALVIYDDEFPIREATLVGILDDPYWCDTFNNGEGKDLRWYLTIKAHETIVEGESQSPMLLHQDVPLAVRNWHSIEDLTFEWIASDEIDAHLYMFESEVITVGNLHFGKRVGRDLALTWSGETEFLCEFAVDTPVLFTGIEVRGNENDTDDSMRARLVNCLETKNLVPGTMQVSDSAYECGLKLAQSVFSSCK